MEWQRARQPKQKAERVTTILASAVRLFDQRDFAEIAMRDIADNAKLSKASLYSYFKTKEEVFATLFLQECDSWLRDVDGRLTRMRSPSPERVARVLTDVLREKQRFCRLTAVLASVVEHNLTKEFIHSFKVELNVGMANVITALRRVLPDLTEQAGRAFVFQHHALIAGLWPLTHPAPLVAEVLANEEFKGMQVDFYKLFQASIERLL